MVLLYFMDGLNFDLAKKHMPFLTGMNIRPLQSEFGYSCACHATMYTGKPVEEHNTWFVWKRGEHSPYRFIDRVPLLKHLNLIPVKMVLSRVARNLNKNTSFSGIPMMVNLPLKDWSQFQPCEDRFWTAEDYLPGTPTLFKLLREQQIPHQLVGFSKGGDVFSEEKQVNYQESEFVYFFIGEVDSVLHQNGEQSDKTIAYLKQTDDFIRDTYEKASATGKPVTVIMFSDHGHIEVEQKIDPNVYFKQRGLHINQYLHLTESTFLRFWFKNDAQRQEVMGVLEDMKQQGLGFIMDQEICKAYRLPYATYEHGEVVFHLNAPNIFTNTIWGYGKTIESMHGYKPKLLKHWGIFASNKPLKEQDFISLTDLLPTVLTELGIDKNPYDLCGNVVTEEIS